MPDFTNIITVDLTEAIGFKVEAHRAVHQWDSGVVLQLTGVTLPSGCRAQFDTKTTTYNQELTDGACEIPNALLGYEMIGDIKCHVYVTDQDYGIVVYDVHIPVIRRPKPDSYIYTDNTSSENGWIKTDNGFKVNEGQTILSRTELSINDNQTILDGTSLSLNNQQTVLDGTHLSLASGLFYADSTGITFASGAFQANADGITFASGAFQAEGNRLRLNSGRITIGPNKLLVDSRVFGTVNLIDTSLFEQGGIDTTSGVNYYQAAALRSKGFIKVKPSTTYIISKEAPVGDLSIRFYDTLGGFISASGGGVAIFNTPSGCEYIKVEIWVGREVLPTECVNIQLEEGSVSSDYMLHSLDNVELTKRKYVQDFESKNLVDLDLIEQGGIGAGGDDYVSGAYLRCGFIPIEGGTAYTLVGASESSILHFDYIWEYDANKACTRFAQYSQTFVTRQESCYVRFRLTYDEATEVHPHQLTACQLIKGSTLFPYVPYALDNIRLTSRRYVQDWKNKNLLDKDGLEQGGLNIYDGTPTDDAKAVRTSLIAVKPGDTYTLSASLALNVYCVFFNTSGTYSYYVQLTTSGLMSTVSFAVGSQVGFIRLSLDNGYTSAFSPSNISWIQLEKGINRTDYVPYALDNIDLTKTTKNLLNNSKSFAITANASTSGGWFVILEKRLPQTSSWQAMISIRTTLYEYTPGAPRTFLVESYYGDIRISPLSSTDDAYDDWIDVLRITRNDNSMYVEGRVRSGIASPSSNNFAITVTDLSGQYGIQYTVPSGFKWTTATQEIRTYDLNKKVNRLLNKGDMYFSRGAGTYDYTITSQPSTYFTLQIFGFVGNVGGVNLTVTCNGGSINVYDNMTNNTFSNNQISFAYNANTGVLSIWSYMGYALFILGL